jgi:glutathione peroxidase
MCYNKIRYRAMELLLLVALAGAFAVTGTSEKSIYDFTMTDIDGKEVKLDKFKGQVLLVVNVASKCGLTPQYEGLERLCREKKEQGFAVLGFPANDFGGQEPGTNEEIKKFCTVTYGVTFPMFSKVSVLGEGMTPLYRWLIDTSNRQDAIEWNFAKFLIGRDGKVIRRFAPKVQPNDSELLEAIEKALREESR